MCFTSLYMEFSFNSTVGLFVSYQVCLYQERSDITAQCDLVFLFSKLPRSIHHIFFFFLETAVLAEAANTCIQTRLFKHKLIKITKIDNQFKKGNFTFTINSFLKMNPNLLRILSCVICLIFILSNYMRHNEEKTLENCMLLKNKQKMIHIFVADWKKIKYSSIYSYKE